MMDTYLIEPILNGFILTIITDFRESRYYEPTTEKLFARLRPSLEGYDEPPCGF